MHPSIAIHNPSHVHLHFGSLPPEELSLTDLPREYNPIRTTKATTSTPPAQGEAWMGMGGYYLGTMPAIQGQPGYHLVISPERANDITYGPRDHDVTGAASQHDGKANTNALLADNKVHPAAQWAAAVRTNGHADFYLPSRAELFLCWLCAPQFFEKSGYYWSSSQVSAHLAWIQGFEYGHSGWGIKGNELRAVAVRQIPLSHFNT